MHVCVVYACVCTCSCLCAEAREGCSIFHTPPYPLIKSLTELGTPPPFFVQLGWLASKTVILWSCPFPTPSTGAVVLRGCGCATFYVAAGIQTQPFVLVQQALCPLSCLLSA